MGRFWRWFWGVLPPLVGAVIIAATQVDPDDATKRLADWVNRYGWEWPVSLTATRVLIIFFVIAVVYYGFLFHKQLRVAPRRFAAAYRAFRALPPVSPKPTVQEVVAIEAVRAAFRNAGGPAGDRIRSLSQDLRGNEGEWVALLWLLERAEIGLRDTQGALAIAVDDRSPERLPGVRQALQNFLVTYGSVVRAVHDFEKRGVVDLLGKRYAGAYAAWEQYHANWMEQLDTIKEQPVLAQVRSAIQENLRTGPGLRYSTLFDRGRQLLESASPDERAFLVLFCADTNPTPESPIEYKVYSAGRSMASNNLLKLAAGENGAERFCLPEPVWHGWNNLGSGPFPKRSFVDVPLSAVDMGLPVTYPIQHPTQ